MENKFIPLSVPNFGGREKEYVNDAVVSEWVSSGGSKVGDFERVVAGYVGAEQAVAVSSGTAGLHLAMILAGVEGCEVITPTLTFIAATNPIRYAGGEPVFIGCDDTLCIDPAAVEEFCASRCEQRDGVLYNKASGRRVAALEVVHVFGNLCDMDRLMATAEKYGLAVIEDATEALGSYYTAGRYAGRYAGTIGDAGVYSFNGNKIITTGSGGMLVANRPGWAAHAKHLSTQAKTDEVQYIHDEVGYNYRLTNLQAALGLAQMEQLEGFIARKGEMYSLYGGLLGGRKDLKLLPFRADTRPNHWFYSLMVDGFALNRDTLIERLRADRIQTRTVWGLIHQQQPYRQNEAYATEKAEFYRQNIVNIPCSTNLQDEDIHRVVDTILSYA